MAVKTYRVVRRQHMGGGKYRENGELLPEAHLWFAPSHSLHVGELEDVEVDEDEFRAALEQYVTNPDQREQILDALGLGEVENAQLDSGIADVPGQTRTGPLVPRHLPAKANARTIKTERMTRPRNRVPSSVSRGESTIMATAVPPGTTTGRGPRTHLQKEQEMALNLPSEGAKGVYEDQSTTDPHELNEVLTNTRPEDIERHNAAAAFDGEPGEDPAELEGSASSVDSVGPEVGTPEQGTASVPATEAEQAAPTTTPNEGEPVEDSPADTDPEQSGNAADTTTAEEQHTDSSTGTSGSTY